MYLEIAQNILYNYSKAQEKYKEQINEKRKLLKTLPRKKKKQLKKEIELDEAFYSFNPYDF